MSTSSTKDALNDIEPVLNDLPPEDKNRIIRAIAQSVSFSGPLPPPEILERYNRIMPDAAERFLSMAEKQQAFSHESDRKDQEMTIQMVKSDTDLKWHDANSRRLGQYLIFFLNLVGFYIAYSLAMNDHDTVAGIVVTAVIGASITGLITGSFSNKKNNISEEKEDTE